MAKTTCVGINRENVKSSGSKSAKKCKRNHHTLAKVAIAGICIKDVSKWNKYKKAAKRLEKQKKADEEYQRASQYFCHGPGGNSMGNVFADSLHNNLNRFANEKYQKYFDKYNKYLEFKQRVGRGIGGVLCMLNNAARTMQMKNITNMGEGKTSGISKNDVPNSGNQKRANNPAGQVIYGKGSFANTDFNTSDSSDDFEME